MTPELYYRSAEELQEILEKSFEKEPNTESSKGKISFTSLAPAILTGKAYDSNKIYLSALKNALDTKENKNIALMGNYGSGKTSILETYKNEYKENVYLNLSLASFLKKETDSEEIPFINKGDNTPTRETGDIREQNNIETWEIIENILVKQMIYKKKKSDLPYSRFKRITNIPKKKLQLNAFWISVYITLWLIAINYSNLSSSSLWIRALFYSLLFIMGFYFVYQGLQLLTNTYRLSKLSFRSFTMEQMENETSYFSRYLDEILYFFEVSKTNVVIIEDIDRFNSIEVFEHLRELNFLLNSSEQIKQSVRFVYAVRDDLFSNEVSDENLKESEEYLRTKFFDLIIPVVPVVDSNNSKEFLIPEIKKILKRHFDNTIEGVFDREFELFLSDIALYIDDLRLLYNICNEFQIYLGKVSDIDNKSDIKKLFAIVVYKNIHPEDFSKLQLNKGKLYSIFEEKKSVLDGMVRDLESEIEELKTTLDSSNPEVYGLAKAAILTIYSDKFPDSNLESPHYSKGNAGTRERVFPLTKEKINYFLSPPQPINIWENYHGQSIKVNVEEIRAAFLRLGVKTDRIIEETAEEEQKEKWDKLKALERKLLFQRSLSIKQIMEENNKIQASIDNIFSDYGMLVKYLLAEGYIDEQYEHLISNFYGATLSKNDTHILRKLKSNTELDKTEELTDYDLALHQLSRDDFRKTAILNKGILLHVFNSNLEEAKLTIIKTFHHGINNNKKGMLLKELFSEPLNRTQTFVSMCMQEDPSIFSKISGIAEKTIEFKKEFIYRIFASCDKDTLDKSIESDPVLKQEVESVPQFISELRKNSGIQVPDLLEFFADKEFEFEALGVVEMDDDDFKFTLRNNIYRINKNNIIDIYIRLTGKTENLFSISELLNQDIKELTNAITEHFDQVVFLLEEQDRTFEVNEMFTRILNESSVPVELKVDIIKKNEYAIKNVSEIENIELREEVFKHQKYTVTLENVIRATENEMEYVLSHFTSKEKIQQFMEELEEKSSTDEYSTEEVNSFMERLVNEYKIEVNTNNIDFFRLNTDYAVEGMSDETFYTLLEEGCIKPTAYNIKNISGMRKMKLISHDEGSVAKFEKEISFKEEEIIIGLSLLKGQLLESLVNRSFVKNKLQVENKKQWLEKVAENNIHLTPAFVNNLFRDKEVTQLEIIIDFMVYVIKEELLTIDDIQTNLKNIDDSLSQVEYGVRGMKTVESKYYPILKELEKLNRVSNVRKQDKKVTFYNKGPRKGNK